MRLTPDTCVPWPGRGCTVDVLYDTPEGTPLGFDFVCPTHAGLVPPPQAMDLQDVIFLYSVIRAEQDTKNRAEGLAHEAVARLRTEGIFEWTWSGPAARRELAVRYLGIPVTSAEKALIRAALAAGGLRRPVTLA
jgi:hypothetical protein